MHFQFSSLSEEDIIGLQQRYEALLAKIRPNAVGLVDAFDLRDEVGIIKYYIYFFNVIVATGSRII